LGVLALADTDSICAFQRSNKDIIIIENIQSTATEVAAREQTFKSFPAAAKAFFGFKPDQKLSEFMEELKQLSPDDRIELAAGLEKHGIKIVG
jgi:hypothetical protein